MPEKTLLQALRDRLVALAEPPGGLRPDARHAARELIAAAIGVVGNPTTHTIGRLTAAAARYRYVAAQAATGGAAVDVAGYAIGPARAARDAGRQSRREARVRARLVPPRSDAEVAAWDARRQGGY
jgi:hypothetical protein